MNIAPKSPRMRRNERGTSDLRKTMTFMAITVPKAVSRETFLETRFTTIRRTLVKVPSYNTRVSQCGSLRIRWLLAKNRRGEERRKSGDERRQRRVQSVTRLAVAEWASISFYLGARERERVTSPYADIKEDSKSEQMAFIVDHRLCRAVRQCTDHTLRKREKHTRRYYNGRFASRRSADATSSERGKQFGKRVSRQISLPSTFHSANLRNPGMGDRTSRTSACTR